VIDLNQFVSSDMGDLVKNNPKFYRINGGSTQLEGVSSDIIMPDRYAYLKMEGDMDMPWDKIDAATYTLWDKTANNKSHFK
jgi:carboxyl-terminal processing protease